MDYSKMSHEDFERISSDIYENLDSCDFLSVAGVRELMDEEYNNEILEKWKEEQEAKPIQVVYHNIDSMNRPVFRRVDTVEKRFYGCTDKLFPYEEPENSVLEKVTADDLVFFGFTFDCEPDGADPYKEIEIIKRSEMK